MGSKDRDTSVADQVVDELLSEGAVAVPGRFGLDREVARQKLRDFQVAEPWSYPLDLLGAACSLGATWMELRVEGPRLGLRFDGRPLTEEDFGELYDALFAGGDDEGLEARRMIARAIGAAQGLGAAAIRISSGDGKTGALLVARAEDKDEIRALEPAPSFTEIQLEHGREGRGGLSRAEVARRICDYVRRRGIYTGAKVSLNGELLPDGWAMPEATTRLAFGDSEQGGALRGVLGATPKADLAAPRMDVGLIRLVSSGVLVETLELDGLPPGATAVVSDSRFRTDLGGGKVLRGPALESATAAALGALASLMERLGHYRVEITDCEPSRARCMAFTPSPEAGRDVPIPSFYVLERPRGAARALEAVKRLLRVSAWGLYISPALLFPKLILYLAEIPEGDYLIVAFVLWVVGFFALLNAFLLLHFLAGPRDGRKQVLSWVKGGQTLSRALGLLGQSKPLPPNPPDLDGLRGVLPARGCLVLRGRILEDPDRRSGDPAVLRDTWLVQGKKAARLTAMQRFTLDLEYGDQETVEVALESAPFIAAPYRAEALPASLSPEVRSRVAAHFSSKLERGLDAVLAKGRTAVLMPGDRIELVLPRGARLFSRRGDDRGDGGPPCVIKQLDPSPGRNRSPKEPT
ncbi:MAG: hypothetical protein RBU30_26050 [Polyangia bacterium]|nr:hypothetical protein [Polyangia bacterium]